MADVLASQFSGHWISRAELGSLSALKTYDPPITALADATLLGTGRQGKFLILHLADADGIPLDLVIHLSRAGWMHWRTSKALAPLRPGKGPVALRLTWRDEAGDTTVLDVTEAGTQKRLAVYLVRDLAGSFPALPLPLGGATLSGTITLNLESMRRVPGPVFAADFEDGRIDGWQAAPGALLFRDGFEQGSAESWLAPR